MPGSNILIIDDEEKLRKLLARIIELEGFNVFEAANGKSALRKMEQEDVDVVICDVRLPDTDGIELCGKIKATYPLSESIVLTAHGNIADGVRAIKNGAFDYITKGDDNDKIIPLICRAVEKVRLQKRIKLLEKQVGGKFSFEKIISKSNVIKEAIGLAQKVAITDTTVLLLGETGTGKEVFAEAIHEASPRNKGVFIAVNCSAISHDLLENELFGHKAGAYTGANKDTIGLFEEARGGTIFLDEIGEMNPSLQAKLLRVLESGEFIKVGDTRITKTNVRIIAATNRDLKHEAEAGSFRLDLYYRLSAFQITLPPLRERTEDIESLAEIFVRSTAAKINRPVVKISAEYMATLKNYSWKGNVRELKNIIERSMILNEGEVLTVNTLPSGNIQPEQAASPADLKLETMERSHILQVLSMTNWNKAKASDMLGIGLTTLYRKLHEYGLE